MHMCELKSLSHHCITNGISNIIGCKKRFISREVMFFFLTCEPDILTNVENEVDAVYT